MDQKINVNACTELSHTITILILFMEGVNKSIHFIFTQDIFNTLDQHCMFIILIQRILNETNTGIRVYVPW